MKKVQVIYGMSVNGEVEIVVQTDSGKGWERLDSHEFTSEEALNGEEFRIPVHILHSLEDAILAGAHLVPDEWRS